MPGAYLWAWYRIGGKWVKVAITATKKLKIKAG